jgi:hypothetical protein
VCHVGQSSGQTAELIPEDTIVRPDDYLTASDKLLDQVNKVRGSDGKATVVAEAHVKAIQAVAAAIDRLAAAVEALPRT